VSDWFTLRWDEGALVLLDQRELPAAEKYLRLHDVEGVAVAIESMVVRGAPAIGCTAAMGIALAAVTLLTEDSADFERILRPAFDRLAKTRPTAVNLFWALGRMRDVLRAAVSATGATASTVRGRLLEEAETILVEDVETCHAIGREGLALIPQNARVLTHCNAGALATGGYGTALGVVRAAHEEGRIKNVFADETRPFLQGARLTAWELARDGVPVSVIADNMAGSLMQKGDVDLVVVGADRIAANGDVANKIGTYPLAVLAREHGLPFYVAAPCSTVDLSTANGELIPIEERGREEVANFGARTVVPDGVPVRNPAFDVTPARLVSAIVTERGVAREPYTETLAAL
jgi:methylthioribose-1-phosphate isomerase